MCENELMAGYPTTLSDWVRNFRLKKIQMKRKCRGDLRVTAMLTKALVVAEAELRRKQQERFGRWLQLQAKLDERYGTNVRSLKSLEDTEEQCKQREQITELWKCELSDLDEFMRNISSSSRNQNNNINDSSNNTQQMQNQSSCGSDFSSKGSIQPSIKVCS